MLFLFYVLIKKIIFADKLVEMKQNKNKINIKNKKAYFDYEIIEKYEAGIVLSGTEIKSIRTGKVSLVDSYCKFIDNELWVLMSIAEYEFGNLNNHEPNRQRKLLLTKRELKKLDRKVKTSGMTIVPLQLYINDRGLAKMEIALVQGKKKYDHRQTIKEKDTKIDMERERKYKY